MEQLQRQRQIGANQQALTVVLCPVLSTAPELAELLASDAAAGRYQLLAHPRIGRAIRALGQLALRAVAPARPILPIPSDGVLLWPVDEPLPTAGQLSRSGRLNIVLCSGAALLPSAVAACRRRLAASGLTLAAALPYPDAIDRPGLLRYIVATGARQIYLTAGFSDSLAAELRAIQVVAWPLGPPQQLALFQ
jgi:hypothetical protein